jgi:hypothetical protein
MINSLFANPYSSNTAQILILTTFIKVLFINIIFYLFKLEYEHYDVFADLRMFGVSNKVWVRKSQIHRLHSPKSHKDGSAKVQLSKVPHFRTIKLYKYATLRICAKQNFFADCPPLILYNYGLRGGYFFPDLRGGCGQEYSKSVQQNTSALCPPF